MPRFGGRARRAWLCLLSAGSVFLGCGPPPITGAPPAPNDVATGQTAAPNGDGGVGPVEPAAAAAPPVGVPPVSVATSAVAATAPAPLDAVPMIGPKGDVEALCRAWERSCQERPRDGRMWLCSCKSERGKAAGEPVAPVLEAALLWTARPTKTGRHHIGLRPALRTGAGWFMAGHGPDVEPEEQGRYLRHAVIEHREWVVFRFRENPKPTDGGRGTMSAYRHGAMICSVGPSATPSCLDPIYGPSLAASPPALAADAQGRLLVGSPGAVIVPSSGQGHPEGHAERPLGDAHPLLFP